MSGGLSPLHVMLDGTFGAPLHPNPLPNGERGSAALGTTPPTPGPSPQGGGENVVVP